MKSKRQTVWLVSMLSLMVVLSAYYLFTEDSPSKNQVADGQQVTTMEGNHVQDAAADGAVTQNDNVILSEVLPNEGTDPAISDEEASTEEQAGASETTPNPKASENTDDANAAVKEDAAEQTVEPKADQPGKDATSSTSGTDATDEDVLKQLESQSVSAADSLTAYQFQRLEQNTKKQEELMQAINDSSKTLDEAAMAQKELSALEEKEEKIYDIEEKLQQKYANAVVTETENKYKVLVVSEKLEAKEAVSIMDLVIKELGVSQDKVSIQYVSR